MSYFYTDGETLYKIYSNIYEMFEDRKIEYIDEKLAIDEFKSKYISNNELLLIHAKGLTVYIATNTGYGTKDIERILKDKKLSNILVVVNRNKIDMNLNKTKTKISKEHKIKIDFMLYKNFLLNPTKHAVSPKYRSIVGAEKEKLLMEIKKDNLQVISKKDPIVRWYGFNVGDILEIISNVDNQCVPFEYSYRIVKNELVF